MAQKATVQLEVDGQPLQVERVDGQVTLSEPFRFTFDVVALNAAARPTSELLGKAAKATVTVLQEDLVIYGVVVSAERVVVGRAARYVVVIESAVAAPLAVGRDHRVYQNMTAVDAIKSVLARNGLDASVRWEATGACATRTYVTQYGESDWSFVERLCAEEGIYYYFDFEVGSTTLVFASDSTQAKPIPGASSLEYKDASMLLASADCVYAVTASSRVASGKQSLDDYDPQHPPLTLDASYSDGTASLELYDFPGRYDTVATGTRLAQTALEARRARRCLVGGLVTGTRLRVGQWFEIAGHPIEAINSKLFVMSLTLSARQGLAVGKVSRGAHEDEGFLTEWVAIPSTTRARPEARRAARTMLGPQTGVVCGPPGEETHADSLGRIRVQFFWDRVGRRDEQASTDMRCGQFGVGHSMILPRCGWEVIAEHHNGDADRPFVMQHLYDGKFQVPYPLPAHQTKTAWQTATTPGGGTSNEMRFEDSAGSEEIFMNASKDMSHTIGNNSSTTVGANHTHQIGVNHTVTVGSNATNGVKGDHSVTIGAMESLTVSGKRKVDITGSDSQSIGAARIASISGGKTVEANGGRSLTVGAAMIEATPMAASRSVLGSTSVTVGGAWISAAAAGMGNATLGASAETVGGAKLQIGGKGIKKTIKGALAETVGGACIASSGGDAAETSDAAISIEVGGAMLVNAPSVSIEADEQISIVVGGASITLTASSIEVKAPSLASPGATVTKVGSVIHHNP